MFETNDPWKAVQQIKLKHEAVVQAAVAVINCAEWQGEGAAKFLSEAIGELKAALTKLSYLQVGGHNEVQSLGRD